MKYQQLILHKRVLISYHLRQGLNPSEIARVIGRHRITVSRELRRNRCDLYDSSYRFSRAHEKTVARRRTKVVGALPDGHSALMLVAARFRHVSAANWGTRNYMSMKLLDEMHKQLKYSVV